MAVKLHLANVHRLHRQIGRAGAHVEASDDAGTFERLALTVLGAEVHEAWKVDCKHSRSCGVCW